MDIYEAMHSYHMVRRYKITEIEESKISSLYKFISELTPLFENHVYKVEIKKDDKEEISKSLGLKAPYFVVISSKQEDDKMSYVNAGYLLQQISLYCFSIGLSSCMADILQKNTAAADGDGMVCTSVLALGYAKEEEQKSSKKALKPALEKICIFKEKVDNEIMSVMESASLAPAPFNVKPCRFVVYNNRIHVFIKKSLLDIYNKNISDMYAGAAIANIHLACDRLWVDIVTEQTMSIKEKDYGRFTYIASIYVKAGNV